MRLDEIAPGAACFVDANIFIYHFTGASEECSDFLNRCEEGAVQGLTSANVILEVLHRLMMVEAVTKNIVVPPQILKKLQRQPERIRHLSDYATHVEKIVEMGITIIPLSWDQIMKSQTLRARHGLLVNDSLVIATMLIEGIDALASNDEGFVRVEEITLYRPTDI